MNISIRSTTEAEEQRKRLCAEEMAQDRQKLLMRWPFIGGIIMRMELVPVRDDRLETACTDGNTVFADVNFYSGLSADERLFVLAHEVWHCVLLHFARRGKRDQTLFNIAADLEIHFALAEEKMREPFVLSHDPKWAGLSAEEIYERLLQNTSSRKEKGKGKGQGKGASGFDKHVYQDGSDLNDPEKMNGESHEKGKKNKDANGDGIKEFVMDQDFSPSISAETPERIRGRVVASAQHLERRQGKLPAHVQKLLEHLQKSELPWQEVLKQFVTSCYGGKRRWLPPSRRHVWQGLYLPSMRTEVLRAVVAVDTSGSTQNDLSHFFAEVTGIMRSFGKFELTLIQCDAKVQNIEHFSDAKLPPASYPWKIYGCGGTDFRPVFSKIAKEKEPPEILIFFTDGFGPAPEKAPPYPVLWILTNDGKKPASWGRKVHFKKEHING